MMIIHTILAKKGRVMSINNPEQPVRKLGDAAGQFTVDVLSEEQQSKLTQYIDRKMNKGANFNAKQYSLLTSTSYLLSDSMTGDQYFVGSAVKHHGGEQPDNRLLDIAPVILQVKGDKIVNEHKSVSEEALARLGVKDAALQMLTLYSIPMYKNEDDGSKTSGMEFARRLTEPKRLAKLISESLASDLENQKELDISPADARQVLRGQTLLAEKLSVERERLQDAIEHEDIGAGARGRPIASQLYQNVFEPEGYTLDKNNELVSAAESKRLQNAAFSALKGGQFINLDDTNGQFIVGKPEDKLASFIDEYAENMNQGAVIGAVTLINKADDNITVLYGVESPDARTGFYDAVTLDQEGMVIAKGRDATLDTGINLGNLNQGQLWTKLDADGQPKDNNVAHQRQQFMSQIGPDNLRRMVSKAQITAYKEKMGKFYEVNNKKSLYTASDYLDFDPMQDFNFDSVGAESEEYLKLKANEVASATFEDRFTLTTIKDKDELYALGKVISVNADTDEDIDGIQHRELVRAIKMEEHWSDNSNSKANPGKVDRVRMLTQVRAEIANNNHPAGESSKATYSTTVHTFDDGIYTGSYKPYADPELSMHLDSAIKNSMDAGANGYDDFDGDWDKNLLSQHAVYNTVLSSSNHTMRNDESIIRARAEYDDSNEYKELIKKLDSFDDAVNSVSRSEQDSYDDGYEQHLIDMAEAQRERELEEEASIEEARQEEKQGGWPFFRGGTIDEEAIDKKWDMEREKLLRSREEAKNEALIESQKSHKPEPEPEMESEPARRRPRR